MVKMYVYFLLFVSFASVYSGESPFMDPSHQPVLNLNAAARGYNIFIGAPFSQNLIDPGIRGQIFKLTKTDKQGRVELHPGVESDKSLSCKVDTEGTVITSVKQYHNEQKTSLIIGEGWQIGRELKLSIGAEIDPVNFKIETEFDPFLNSKDVDEMTTEDMESFFTKEKGAIVQLKAMCVKNWIRLSFYLAPKFRRSFIVAQKGLYSAVPEKREQEFRTFLSVYGTHYSGETVMGSRMVYSRRYTNTEKQVMSKQGIVDCSKKHSQFLWGTYDSNKNDCITDAGAGHNIDSKYVNREHLSSVGSKPFRDLQKWAEQELNEPVPIKMKLRPIIELFTSKNLAKFDINATQMLEWYIPMYLNSCSLMNYQCNKGHKICGIWDDCAYGTVCVENGTSYYCQKSNVSLYWRRHKNPESIASNTDKIRVWTLGGNPVMDMEKPRCSTRYCNYTIEGNQLMNDHFFTIEPKSHYYAWTTEFGTDKWTKNHNINYRLEILRLPQVKGYWLNIQDTSTGNILIRYLKQCNREVQVVWDKEHYGNMKTCVTKFHGNNDVNYVITAVGEFELPYDKNRKHYVVQKVFRNAYHRTEPLQCDIEKADRDCDNLHYVDESDIWDYKVPTK